MNKTCLMAAVMAACVVSSGMAQAQVAGASTTVGRAPIESTEVAMGWSVKKAILGKVVYSEAGDKIGKVQDLIISPERSVTYLIIGAGGFLGIGRHDVAIPVSQIQDRRGKLVMPGATKAALQAMPTFNYADDSTKRNLYIASADQDIAKAQDKLADLQKRASVAAIDAKAKLDAQIAVLQADLSSAQSKLAELKNAAANRWTEFEAGVSAATERLRRSIG